MQDEETNIATDVHRAAVYRRTTELYKLNMHFVVPFHFLALKAQSVVLVSAFVIGSTVGQFLVGCSSTHGPPVPSHL